MSQPGLFDPPEPKPPKKFVRDPAMAAAIAKCIMASVEPSSRLIFQVHPSPCRYCEFSFERRLRALLEFNEWAGWAALDKPPGLVDPDWPTLEPQVEAFMRLPYEEQLRLTEQAAGYAPGTYGKNTGYEYPIGQAQGSRKSAEVHGKSAEVHGKDLGDVKSFTDDSKGTSPGTTDAEPREVGGRPEPRERRGRGIGGPETPEGAAPGGLPDRAEEAPGPDEGDLPVQADPRGYYEPDGKPYPF